MGMIPLMPMMTPTTATFSLPSKVVATGPPTVIRRSRRLAQRPQTHVSSPPTSHTDSDADNSNNPSFAPKFGNNQELDDTHQKDIGEHTPDHSRNQRSRSKFCQFFQHNNTSSKETELTERMNIIRFTGQNQYTLLKADDYREDDSTRADPAVLARFDRLEAGQDRLEQYLRQMATVIQCFNEFLDHHVTSSLPTTY